jgi:hypothetical protein
VLRWAYWWNSTEDLPEDVTNEQVLIELNRDFSSWATNSSLVLTNLEMSAGGDYWVDVCNSLGCVTSASARLVVNPAGISLGLYPGVTVDGVVGRTYGIQYTTNVTVTNLWTTLINFTLIQSVHLWIDTEADTTSGKQPKRFYRVIPIP